MEIKGKYNTAVIYSDELDDWGAEILQGMTDAPYLSGCKIRVMPDVHAGKGCTIGTTMTLTDKVVPNMVGVDIGCGMETIRITDKAIDFDKLDKIIRNRIPSGRDVRQNAHPIAEEIDLSQLRCMKQTNINRAYLSIGTLGGGNHFIEIDKDDEGSFYIVIHSGSRHLGLEVAGYYQEESYTRLCGNSKKQIIELIERLKAEGRSKDIQKELIALKQNIKTTIAPDMAYAEGDLFDDYIHDMKITQQFAVLNRKAMADEIISNMGFSVAEDFTTIHNYIDTDSMILRKGAVSAQKGEKLLIPINMEVGSLICIGKGNPDWNYSAPHGAGRLMSRRKAKNELSMEEYQKRMKGIYTTCVSYDTLDEAPMAYKKAEHILKHISPTANVIKHIKPVYNFKACE